MAAAVLALVALLQAAPADGPVSTAPKVPVIRPAQAAALPSAGQVLTAARAAAQPPTDDYGYVAWCYGALDSYLNLYDRVMPEVTRIERAFPGPRGAEADLRLYPQMRDQAKKDLALYRAAIVAAERASPRVIGAEGAVALRKGRAVWAGAAQATNAQVAREWMGWSPPARCGEVAKTLTVRSQVLGQALMANQDEAAPTSALATAPEPEPTASPAPIAATPPRPAPAVAAAAAPRLAPAAVAKPPAPVVKPVATAPKPTPKPATPKVATGLKPALPPGAFVIDPDKPRGCPGRIDATIKDGRIAMVCVP
jgi:hypothetical protein